MAILMHSAPFFAFVTQSKNILFQTVKQLNFLTNIETYSAQMFLCTILCMFPNLPNWNCRSYKTGAKSLSSIFSSHLSVFIIVLYLWYYICLYSYSNIWKLWSYSFSKFCFNSRYIKCDVYTSNLEWIWSRYFA